jgi:hypothetical protein
VLGPGRLGREPGQLAARSPEPGALGVLVQLPQRQVPELLGDVVQLHLVALCGVKHRPQHRLQVAIYGAHGQASVWYGTNPRWNSDGTFNSHAMIALPGIRPVGGDGVFVRCQGSLVSVPCVRVRS